MSAIEARIKHLSQYLEKSGWVVIFFGMLTQLSSEYPFPSYNVVLGFWAAYCAFTTSARATFGFITFSLLSIILDIGFCGAYGPHGTSSSFKFSLTMFIFCLFAKLFAISSAARFFSAMGGAWTLEASLQRGDHLYDTPSNYEQLAGGYVPPKQPFRNQRQSSDPVDRRRSRGENESDPRHHQRRDEHSENINSNGLEASDLSVSMTNSAMDEEGEHKSDSRLKRGPTLVL